MLQGSDSEMKVLRAPGREEGDGDGVSELARAREMEGCRGETVKRR